MSVVAHVALRVLHCLYSLVTFLISVRLRVRRPPRPLSATRQKTPKHLALLFVSENDESQESAMVESVERTIMWCREVGIQRLTVYDRKGLLVARTQDIRACFISNNVEEDELKSDASEIAYPLTPPLSDASDSRSLSPDPTHHGIYLDVPTITTIHNGSQRKTRNRQLGVRRRTSKASKHSSSEISSFTVHIVSEDMSKPAVARVARVFAKRSRLSSAMQEYDIDLSVDTLQAILEGPRGLPPPDLMIIHDMNPAKRSREPLELHSFPPWQIRLTEFHYSQYRPPWHFWPRRRPVLLEETEFRRALDEFAGAEMRLGK